MDIYLSVSKFLHKLVSIALVVERSFHLLSLFSLYVTTIFSAAPHPDSLTSLFSAFAPPMPHQTLPTLLNLRSFINPV